MFLDLKIVDTIYYRKSKNGLLHAYNRKKTVAMLRCDNCHEIFQRDLKKINKKRLSNNYFHVCIECDAKRFAQRKGVERKKIWDMPASLDWPVGKH